MILWRKRGREKALIEFIDHHSITPIHAKHYVFVGNLNLPHCTPLNDTEINTHRMYVYKMGTSISLDSSLFL